MKLKLTLGIPLDKWIWLVTASAWSPHQLCRKTCVCVRACAHASPHYILRDKFVSVTNQCFTHFKRTVQLFKEKLIISPNAKLFVDASSYFFTIKTMFLIVCLSKIKACKEISNCRVMTILWFSNPIRRFSCFSLLEWSFFQHS